VSLVEKVVSKQQQPRPEAKQSVVADETQAESVDREGADRALDAADFSDESLVASGLRLRESDGNWQLSKQFRRIKRPILRFAENHTHLGVEGGNVIMVSSAIPREGKTFCAANLALALAREPNLDVLLIDADVHRPMLSKIVGLKNTIGLLDYLCDETMQPEDLFRETGRERLTFVSAGHANDDVHELLASQRAREFVDRVAVSAKPNVKRIVVIDSPPLLPTTEAQVVAGLVGMVVMVVDSSTTSPDSVTRALEQIHTDKAVNYILNRAAESVLTGYQGGYYGYGNEVEREDK